MTRPALEDLSSCERVTEWLKGLGLGQYAEPFARNEITWEVLVDLNEEDLLKLGVLALGHRKVLLKAITNSRSNLLSSDSSSCVSPDPILPSAERRQITVLFCDLVNSVGLSARFDPEDLAAIVSAYQACCESVIRNFDGYVARFTGDGVKAYFGYPRATEYDPERAVRAGLALIVAVKRLVLYPELVLSTRIGIATGDVVVGEVIGRGEAQERTVAGETPNLAARLQVVAEPDSVVISDTTKRLIGRLFEYVDLGHKVLKGFPDPMQAWRVQSEGSVGSHFEALRTEMGLTPLVGRDDDLELLRKSWNLAKLGQGQSILLTGEAGVGKSRLTVALRHGLLHESFSSLCHYCSPYHLNSMFYPIIKQLEHDANFSYGDGTALKLERLEKLLSEYEFDTAQAVPLFASLLSIPTEEIYPPLIYNPRQQKRVLVHALEARIVKRAQKNPLLVIFEDLHWVDPSTHEFLGRLIKKVSELPILLVLTARPEFVPSWDAALNVKARGLYRLPRSESEKVVRLLDRSASLSSKDVDQILDYSNGLPLYLEELTKSVFDAEDKDHGKRKEGATAGGFKVPATLSDSLMARLDRLGPQKVIAQTGAVIGRNFTFKLLAALFPQDLDGLDAALQGLVRADLVVEHGKAPDSTYTFTHALLQEAAVACLLHADQRSIHRRIAQALEEDFPEIKAAEPELLALHYTGAGLADSAIGYWEVAAERALRKFANVEAASHFEQALALLETLPLGNERNERELKLRTGLGATLTTIKGFAAPEVAIAYERARVLCNGTRAPAQRFSVLRGLWVYDLVRAEWQAASDLAQQMLVLAEEQHNTGYELESHRALGMTLLWRGMFTEARDHLRTGSQLYNPEHHRAHAFQYGNDPGIACLVHEAFLAWLVGYPDQALAMSRKAVLLARDLGHPFSLAQALTYSMFIHQCRGEPEAIAGPAGEVSALAKEHGFPFWLAEADIMLGWAVSALGNNDDGITRLRQGIKGFLATGARMDRPRWLALLAEAYGANGQWNEGLDAAEEALRVVGDTGETFFQARLCQLKGDLVLKGSLPDRRLRGEACLTQALEIARGQGAKSWELRAATSMARLWQSQSRRSEGIDLLAPLIESFTEGFDTADLRDAKILMRELS